MTNNDLTLKGIKVQNNNIQKDYFINALVSKNVSQDNAESIFTKFNKNQLGASKDSLDIDEQISVMAYLKATAGTPADDLTITSEDYQNSNFDNNKMSEEELTALTSVMKDLNGAETLNAINLVYKEQGLIEINSNTDSNTYEFTEDKTGVKTKVSKKGTQRMYDDNRPRVTLKNGWNKSRISNEDTFNVNDFKDCITTEEVLNVLLSKRNVAPNEIDMQSLATDLMYYNPSLFDKENNTLFLDPNWERLDFPSTENLKKYYGLNNSKEKAEVQNPQELTPTETKRIQNPTSTTQKPELKTKNNRYPAPSTSIYVNKNKTPVHVDASNPKLYNGTLTEPVIEVGGVIYYKINPVSSFQPEAKKAFNDMAAAAAKDGHTLTIRSGWRNHDKQKTLFNNAVKSRGFNDAVKCSAIPGYSEHETGCAVDINYADRNEINTSKNKADFEWLINNAYRYGYILSYPRNNEQGLMYEPWHWLYVGSKEAERIHRESGGKR